MRHDTLGDLLLQMQTCGMKRALRHSLLGRSAPATAHVDALCARFTSSKPGMQDVLKSTGSDPKKSSKHAWKWSRHIFGYHQRPRVAMGMKEKNTWHWTLGRAFSQSRSVVGCSWLCHFHFRPGKVRCSVWRAQLQRSRNCATATSGGIFPHWDQCAACRRCSGKSLGGRTSVRSKFRSLQVQMVPVLRCFKMLFKMLFETFQVFTNCRDTLIGGFKSFCFHFAFDWDVDLKQGSSFLGLKTGQLLFVYQKQNRIPIETQAISLNHQDSCGNFLVVNHPQLSNFIIPTASFSLPQAPGVHMWIPLYWIQVPSFWKRVAGWETTVRLMVLGWSAAFPLLVGGLCMLLALLLGTFFLVEIGFYIAGLFEGF